MICHVTLRALRDRVATSMGERRACNIKPLMDINASRRLTKGSGHGLFGIQKDAREQNFVT